MNVSNPAFSNPTFSNPTFSNPIEATSLSGRRALVTGGASGIGAAASRALAARGAQVVVADVDGEAAEVVAAEIGGSAWTVDLLEANALTDAALAGPLDGIDILVNNAGIQKVSPIEQFDPADFRRIISLMLEAPFLLIRAALPGMYERGFGRIINVSSVHGIRASAFKSAYVSAKHGLEGLSKVRTPLVERQLSEQAAVHGMPESEVLSRIMLTESAIKRLVEPEEVASLIAWLASRESAMVTGASYTMDGGWSAR